METNIYDKVLDKLNIRRDAVRTKLNQKFKKTNPVRMMPMDRDTEKYIYNNMTEEDLMYAVQTYGREAVNQWIFEVRQRRAK